MRLLQTQKNIFIVSAFYLITSPIQSHAQSDIENIGTAFAILIPASAYASTFWLDDKEGRNELYKAGFSNLGVTYALKYTVQEERPDKSGNDSFPSKHTSIAFQGASFIQQRYGPKYGLPAYAAATFVGWSRIEANKHYITDVIAGATIGVLSSYYFTTPYKGIKISPYFDGKTSGITISKHW